MFTFNIAILILSIVIAMKACHSEQKFNEVEFAKNPFRS